MIRSDDSTFLYSTITGIIFLRQRQRIDPPHVLRACAELGGDEPGVEGGQQAFLDESLERLFGFESDLGHCRQSAGINTEEGHEEVRDCNTNVPLRTENFRLVSTSIWQSYEDQRSPSC